MARINIEDDIESQKEFGRLARLLGGDLDLTLGKLVRFFRVAQDHYCDGTPLTAAELGLDGLECMIHSGWAHQTDQGGFQVKNPEKHFGWIRKKKEAARAGGQARAEAPRDATGRFQPEASHGPATVQPDAGFTPATVHPESSPLPLPALSFSKEKRSIGDVVALAQLWNEHCGSLQKVRSPEKLDAKRAKMAATALKAVPELSLWMEAFKRMAASPFCQGKQGKGEHKDWRATFKFAVTPGTIDQVLEGAYGCQPLATPTSLSAISSRQQEIEKLVASGALAPDGSILEVAVGQ